MDEKRHLLEHRLAFRFWVLAGQASQHLARLHKKKYGLSVQAWHTMSVIGRFATVTPKEISELSTMDAFKVSRYVAKLEKEGWVARRIDAQDKRRVLLELTPKGQRVYAHIEAEAQAIEEELLSVLDESDQVVLDRIMTKLEMRGRQYFTE
jgi:DNA-binding MarR family transcriptional regulator